MKQKRKTLLKLVGFNIDPQVASKFDEFCARHPGEPRAGFVEFALTWITELSEPDFHRLYEPFAQWRSLRKREIRLDLAKGAKTEK